jgi:hypothetical protein
LSRRVDLKVDPYDREYLEGQRRGVGADLKVGPYTIMDSDKARATI